ncbi:MAG: lipoyl synthase [Clostridiales Family XIII bacterium]|jgi:lipoic acid synthetase|nr:lipoyl synthase [Clostridiales Family XIII bacterium]
MNTGVEKKPVWLRRRFAADPNMSLTEKILGDLNLNTVCREALCPNYAECFSKKTATFMILGVNCTRNCRFCNVAHGLPEDVDADEPARIGLAVARLGLRYTVVTSVTRDDLPDGGAGQFAAVVEEIRRQSPETAVEVLIPDFRGDEDALRTVAAAHPTVISHNMETVKNLYGSVRPEAEYERSLRVVANIKKTDASIHSKSGVMVGLGETKEQVLSLMDDLRAADCAFITIGQYLAPSKAHHAVVEYIRPDVFAEYAQCARDKGFDFVASAPFVRSSYRAEEALETGGTALP